VHTNVTPLRWSGARPEGALELIDQRLIPAQQVWVPCATYEEVAAAITDMVVRGAPAIGITAAYGAAIGARDGAARDAVLARLADTRPTAVNLFWAIARMRARWERAEADGEDVVAALFAEADAIREEDLAANLAMGRAGAALLGERARVLTHCNTGGLATAGYGTALGVLRAAHDVGKLAMVWVDETRPYLQGARLTAWECLADGLPATLITDNMAAHFMARGEVDAVIVGADRIGANGHVANKIGTYGLAVLCAHHSIPFYVAAPTTTLDPEITSGGQIPIEQRSADEVTTVRGQRVAPEGIAVAHPAFDVTPPELITAIVTERGVARPPYAASLAAALAPG
jgi:methylthioribose-1-phosphate isomerase